MKLLKHLLPLYLKGYWRLRIYAKFIVTVLLAERYFVSTVKNNHQK